MEGYSGVDGEGWKGYGVRERLMEGMCCVHYFIVMAKKLGRPYFDPEWILSSRILVTAFSAWFDRERTLLPRILVSSFSSTSTFTGNIVFPDVLSHRSWML